MVAVNEPVCNKKNLLVSPYVFIRFPSDQSCNLFLQFLNTKFCSSFHKLASIQSPGPFPASERSCTDHPATRNSLFLSKNFWATTWKIDLTTVFSSRIVNHFWQQGMLPWSNSGSHHQFFQISRFQSVIFEPYLSLSVKPALNPRKRLSSVPMHFQRYFAILFAVRRIIYVLIFCLKNSFLNTKQSCSMSHKIGCTSKKKRSGMWHFSGSLCFTKL